MEKCDYICGYYKKIEDRNSVYATTEYAEVESKPEYKLYQCNQIRRLCGIMIQGVSIRLKECNKKDIEDEIVRKNCPTLDNNVIIK